MEHEVNDSAVKAVRVSKIGVGNVYLGKLSVQICLESLLLLRGVIAGLCVVSAQHVQCNAVAGVYAVAFKDMPVNDLCHLVQELVARH